MKPGVPWSVKGIEPEARAAAKKAAQQAGMTLGQWLNKRILEAGAETAGAQKTEGEEWTPPPQKSDQALAELHAALADMSRRFDEVERHNQEIIANLNATLNLTRNAPAPEQTSPPSPTEQDLLAQLNATKAELLERIDGLESELRATATRDPLKPLAGTLSSIVRHLETSEKRAVESMRTMEQAISHLVARLESVEARIPAPEGARTPLQSLEERIAAVEREARDTADAIRERLYELFESLGLEAGASLQSARLQPPLSADTNADLRLEALEAGLHAIERKLSLVEHKNAEITQQIAHQLSRLSGNLERADRASLPPRPLARRLIDPFWRKKTGPDGRREGTPSTAPLQTTAPPLQAVPVPPPLRKEESPSSPSSASDGGKADMPETPQRAEAAATDTAGEDDAARLSAAEDDTLSQTDRKADPDPPPETTPATAEDAFSDFAAVLEREAPSSPIPEEKSAEPADTTEPKSPPNDDDAFPLAKEPRESYRTADLPGSAQPATDPAQIIPGAERADGPGPETAEEDGESEETPARQRLVLIVVIALSFLAMIAAAVILMGKPSLNSLFDPFSTAQPVPQKDVVMPTGRPATAEEPGAPLPEHSAPLQGQEALSAPVAISVSDDFSEASLSGAQTDTAQDTVMPTAADAPSLATLQNRAADGDAWAQLQLGLRYFIGDGVAVDSRKGAGLIEQAANQGLAPAQYRLGALYEGGTGVEQNLDLARSWYEKAAQAGNRKAMYNLGVLYAEGTGADQDYATAVTWFTKAANLGLTDSQYNLGILLHRGLGAPRDPVQAYKWFALAAAQGDRDAARMKDQIEQELDATTLASANALIDVWRPQPLDETANADF